MKAKTKLQKEIIGLSRKMHKLSDVQKRYALEHCFDHLAHRSAKNVITCMECGHSWNGGNELADTLLGVVCPHCGKKLELVIGRKRLYKDKEYFSIITTCKQYQVIRYFSTQCIRKLGQPAEYSVFEVVQRWISPDGVSTTVARKRGFAFVYYDLWIPESKMEIRTNQNHYVYDIKPTAVYPKMRFIREIRRNGFNGNFYGMKPYDLFMAILNNRKHETLLKAGQIPMLHYTLHSIAKLERYWDSIKICIRNNYTVLDGSTWCDYIDMLQRMGKDIHNACYVCPVNLKAAHDRLVDRQNRERTDIKIKEAKAYEEEYRKKKGKFFGLVFTDGTIRIKVLESVVEFVEEGNELHHCVYANRYYSKDSSLILSASIGGIRMETIEISLTGMKIIQCRGKHNANSQYHDRIVRLMNENMNEIRARMSA